ncbi:GNAT family N-acetyltransferase [Actinokineospora sp. NBRC 105648]|uniref:GNAT family N-acetyltransferase n=1 Tax=Actinokineospora sp. NBRC 105648 TaxID=3032206 RepID=UPI0024A1BF79|nr:GNAT family N-acetyltransferase [Actinokineospora sp. NBRC 105648]GLZ37554.1 N-acetyltransferase [Actinokineospora sp. NBRC 105648]
MITTREGTVRDLQALAQRIFSPASLCHVGDLAWQRFQHAGREAEWTTRVWERDGVVLAWGWVDAHGLQLLVDPAFPYLAGAVLDEFPGHSVPVLDSEVHVIAALVERGYRAQEGPFSVYLAHPLTDLATPVLPDGFHARHVTPADLDRRVEVHRAAWHPSRVTAASYAALSAAWPYQATLDWVIEAPDGTFAASCLIWLDPVHRVAELEPVGTAPTHRRKGLARAVCLAAMRAARDAGAERAIVYPVVGDPRSVGALPLYLGLGFTQYGRCTTYRGGTRSIGRSFA